MRSKTKQWVVAGYLAGVAYLLPLDAHAILDPNAGSVFDVSGVQLRVGKVTKIRVEAGETRFQIDSCPEDPVFPRYFAIASDNPDKLDITRLLVAAMTFKKEIKVYNASYGDDIDYCPGTGASIGNITVGTVRVQ